MVSTVVLPIRHCSNHGLYFPRDLNLLEVHTGFPCPPILPTKYTQVIEQKESHNWVCLFSREEQPMLSFPVSLHTMGNLSLSTVCRDFFGAGSGRLADPLMLFSQVASAKFASQCFHVPGPIILSIVFNSPLYCWWMIGDAIHSISAVCLGPGIYEVVSEWVPLFDPFLSGVPFHYRTCFSRSRMFFGAVAWVTGYISSHPVVASTVVSTWHLPWHVRSILGSVLETFITLHMLNMSLFSSKTFKLFRSRLRWFFLFVF